eukprot:326759_1
MKYVMDRINFCLLSALHHGRWKPKRESRNKKYENMKWSEGDWKLQGYDAFAVRLMNSLRGLGAGDAMKGSLWIEQWKAVFETPRIAHLVKIIDRYTNIDEFETDDIIKDILDGTGVETNANAIDEEIEMNQNSDNDVNKNKKKASKTQNKQKEKKTNNKKKEKENKSKKPRTSKRPVLKRVYAHK